MRTKTECWRNLSGMIFSIPLTELLETALIRELGKGFELKVCVGSDSQVYGDEVHYATAVMVIRKGKGAFAFIRKERRKEQPGIKERMLNEVSLSVEAAYDIRGILDHYNIEMEVHADINTETDFKSNVALKDAMGYILGMGYTFKAKPYAFASSSCADIAV